MTVSVRTPVFLLLCVYVCVVSGLSAGTVLVLIRNAQLLIAKQPKTHTLMWKETYLVSLFIHASIHSEVFLCHAKNKNTEYRIMTEYVCARVQRAVEAVLWQQCEPEPLHGLSAWLFRSILRHFWLISRKILASAGEEMKYAESLEIESDHNGV